MNADFSRFEPLALELAAAAATETLPWFRQSPAVDDKGVVGAFDPVTRADRDAEAAIRRLLSTRAPDHGVIGEEYGEDRPDAELVWVLDPVDGTRAFISGLPLWTTLIALMHDGEPVLGVVAQPYLGEVFIGGAWGSRLVRRGEADRPLSARPCADLAEATLSTTDPAIFLDHERAAWERLRGRARLARLGCDAYAYAMVSMGAMDVVAETSLKLWDWAAHAPLIRGAGGVVTGWNGEAPGADGRIIAAGDPRVLEQVIETMAWKS